MDAVSCNALVVALPSTQLFEFQTRRKCKVAVAVAVALPANYCDWARPSWMQQRPARDRRLRSHWNETEPQAKFEAGTNSSGTFGTKEEGGKSSGSSAGSDVSLGAPSPVPDDDKLKAGLGIVTFLKDKHIFVTGATGFLAKVLVEKILREQPDIGQLYLLIQPRNKIKPEQRLQDVMNSGLFEVLRKIHGDHFQEFMESKLTVVPGNITTRGLGMDQILATQVVAKVDIIVNSAASTDFRARYDKALDINTLGAKRVLEFGKRCARLQMFLQVSTAYVNGTRQGATPEKPFRMGDSIAKEKLREDAPTLDPEKELEDANKLLDDLQYAAESETVMTKVMVDLGMKRAKTFGWQDTYVFSKAMGEMLIDQGRGTIPVAIIRPSIVESTFSEPFPGWMEGHRMVDPIITGYGKGLLKGVLAQPENVLDMIPCDMVVSAILAAMVKHNRQPGLAIYQVASSVVNPLSQGRFVNILYEYFNKNPLLASDGAKVKVKPMPFIPNLMLFKIFLYLSFTLPQQLRYIRTKRVEILGSLASAKKREKHFNRI